MFAIDVEVRFSAAHALMIMGRREPLHGHDFLVRARVVGAALDDDGLLVDFHALHADLEAIIRPFHNANLNEQAPFDRINPSAERLAEHICMELSRALETRLAREPKKDRPRGVRVESVYVTEAPGCAAIFSPAPRS
jgi:6-pyruvoyltetrahydropterin/6-carboxytetrahydropterin synthase